MGAAFASEAGAEERLHAGQAADIGAEQRGEEGAADRHEGGLEQRVLPLAGDEPDGHRAEEYDEGETAQTEPFGNQGVGPFEPELASEIGHAYRLVHHGGVREQALVLFPREDI